MTSSAVLDIQSKPTIKTFGTVVVTHIVDPFNPLTSKKSHTDLHGRSLSTYLTGYALGINYLVAVNGRIITDVDNYTVQPNDSIVFTPTVQGGGGGGKQILALVAIIALSIVAPMAGAWLAGGTFGAGGLAALTGGAFAMGLLYTTAIMVAGSLLINALMAPDVPSTNISTPELESQTYSWSGISTSRTLNTPIPVLYGTHALGGTVINNRFFYKGTDDWMAVQIALCHGEVEEIEANDIKVEDAPFSTFVGNPVGTDGDFQFTTGTLTQPIMSGFSDSVYNNSSATRKLEQGEVFTFTSTSTNIDFFRIHFEFPKGLYRMDKQGNKLSKTVKLAARYRKVGTTNWSNILERTPQYITEYQYGSGTSAYWSSTLISGQKYTSTRKRIVSYIVSPELTFTSNSSVPLKRYYEPSADDGFNTTLEAGEYEFQVWRITANDSPTDVYNVSDSHVRFLEEINTADINYGGIAMLGINIKATDQLSSTRPNFITTVTRKPLWLAGKYRESTNPAWICYDILTNKLYGMGVHPDKINLTEFERWAIFCDGGLANTYPLYKPSFVLENYNLASGKLVIPESELPEGERLTLKGLNVSLSTVNGTGLALVNGKYIDVELDVNHINRIDRVYEKNNPLRADGIYYYVTFKYPLKVGSLMSYDLVHRTITSMTAPKLKFNGLFDTTTDIWTAVQDVAKLGRGQIVLQGTKYSCIYDSIKSISGLYNASNSNNVSVNYLSTADIATEIEIQYTDKNIGYEMTSISIQDADAVTNNIRTNKTSLTVKGITDETEALIFGRYMLATSKYIRRVVTFDADIESITQTVGDLIAVQTDVTQYGKGGMVKSVVGQVVILDDVMYFEQHKPYTLKIKSKSDDSIKDYTFTTSDVSPWTYTTFDALSETPVGVIKFDDINLIVYQEEDSWVSSNAIIVPEGYEIEVEDRYAFGIKGSDSILCTITDISRDGDLTRRITAAEYNESILDFDYDNDVLQRISPTVKPKNEISNIVMSDRLVKLESGTTVAMLSVSWESTVSSYYNMYIMEDDFKNYLLMGIKGNRVEYPAVELVPEKQYRIYVEDAQDMGVFDYKNYTITSFSSVPEPITDIIITSNGDDINFEVDYPLQPLDFSHYELYLDGRLHSKQLSDTFSIKATTGKLSYPFQLRAVDMINKKGAFTNKTFNLVKPSISLVTYVQEKEYIKFNIVTSDGSFAVDSYEAMSDIGTYYSKDSSFTIIGNWVGSKTFTFRVYDVLGNTNGTYTLAVSISVPGVTGLTSSIDVRDAVIRWEAPTTGLPIDYYEVEYDTTVYKTKSNTYRLPIQWLGDKVFNVRAVNTLGAVSSNVRTTVTVVAGHMTQLQTEVIDNNVLLRWSATPATLPIETFILYKGADETNLEVIGEKKGTFTTVFENAAGTYTYWMAPVDSAGNIGTMLSATTQVNEPPDYILNTDWYSDFSGTKYNAIVESNLLVLPVLANESIEMHFDSRSWDSAQEQIVAGYPRWIEPFGLTGTYTETFDYGTILSSSMITVSIDKSVIQGTPDVSVTISISSDGTTYVDYVDQQQIYGTGFRYVKVSLSVTGVNSAVSVHTINVKLDSKLKNDAGTGTVTNASAGVYVPFNKSFTDIASIQVTPIGTTPIIPIYDFEDTPNPLGFTVYLYNTSGNRITGNFSWSARGY